MKKLKTLLYGSLLLFSIGNAVAQVSTVNLVAKYSFSGNANDGSGNGNNGTVNGATLTTDRNGNTNSAYSFNNTEITMGTFSPCWAVSSNFTIAAWVKTSGTTRQDIVDLGSMKTTNDGISLHIEADGRVRCDLTNVIGPTSTATVNNGAWHFIAATLTNNTMQVYVDGVASGSTQVMTPQITCAGARIGRYINPNGTILYPLNGAIDEISIYSRALSLCEIKQLGGFADNLPEIMGVSNICKDQVTTFSNTSTGGTWASDNNAVATVSALGVVTGVSEGVATISYSLPNTCTAIEKKTITVNILPAFAINGSATICPNSTSAYSISPTAAYTQYYWVMDNSIKISHTNGMSTAINVESSDTPGISYTIKAIGVNACGTSSEANKVITINSDVPAKPVLACSGTNCTTLSVNNPGSGVTIQWYLGGTLNTAYNGLTSITRPQDTQVQVTFTKGSCSYSTFYYPSYCVDIVSQLAEAQALSMSDSPLKIYPNPNSGSFSFTTKGYKGKAFVLNSIGSVMEEIELYEAKTNYDIQLNNLTSGTYLLKLTGDMVEQNAIFIVE